MSTFAVKRKRTKRKRRSSHPSRFSYRGPDVVDQQTKIHSILHSTGAQAKLNIGQPNDKYEREADRVSDRVMSMPDPKLQRQPVNEEEEETVQSKPLADQITPLMQRQEESPEEEEETVQAKGDSAAPSTASSSVESGINSIRGNGQPLAVSTRAFFEPRFGANFSGVRVHTDSNANNLTRSVYAKAFTFGNNIVFGSGHYSPATTEGKRLMSHELTHVVQQGAKGSNQSLNIQKAPSPPPICSEDMKQPAFDFHSAFKKKGFSPSFCLTNKRIKVSYHAFWGRKGPRKYRFKTRIENWNRRRNTWSGKYKQLHVGKDVSYFSVPKKYHDYQLRFVKRRDGRRLNVKAIVTY